MLALEGLRILDLSRYLPGSFASLCFADFGAEVIMIEDPKQGEPGRKNAPYIKGISARHLLLQRNKKSMSLDIRSNEGKEIFSKLLATADVVIENFKPGYLTRIGLDYTAASKINPRIIYCSLSGFGQYGERNQIAGHDINYIALAGVMGLSGSADTPPPLPGVQLADMTGSLMGQIGILLALSAREKTGRGQQVDVAFFDAAIGLLPLIAAPYFAEEKSYQPGEHIYTGSQAWYNVYPTKDNRYIAIGALETKFWHQLCDHLQVSEFKDLQWKADQQPEMKQKLQEIFRSKTQQQWQVELEPLNICCSAVRTTLEVFSDPAVIEREMVVTTLHPTVGEIKQIGFPIKLSDTPAQIRKSAPNLGESNNFILTELGYSASEIEILCQKNVLSMEFSEGIP